MITIEDNSIAQTHSSASWGICRIGDLDITQIPCLTAVERAAAKVVFNYFQHVIAFIVIANNNKIKATVKLTGRIETEAGTSFLV